MTAGCDPATLATSSSKLSKQADFYPNPFSSVLNVNLNEMETGSTLMIYNSVGSRVLQTQLKNKNNIISTKLPAGTYFYQMTDKNGSKQAGKLISKP